jgi:CDP-6-deoxy-D-xylo-4-hexulose-3-dehydrase
MKKKFYPLVENPFRKKDLKSAIKVIKSGKITIGKYTNNFEKIFSKKIGTKNTLMVNSGSSANLLAFQCLINPYRKKRLKIGDQVLIPSVCWSTSLWPIIQSGLKPVFVDVDVNTLNINLLDLKKKITKRTKALMLVHVLGNSTNMDKLKKIIKKKKLIVVEDTCESLGSKYKNKYLGTYGDFSAFSFYTSHQISAGEGGMISCKSKDDYEIIKSLRSHGWSRGLKKENQIAKQFPNIDKRFIFYNSGFNLRPTDVSAAIGLSQFKDMNKLINIRNYNRDLIVNSLKRDKLINDNLVFIEPNLNIKPAWFGIPILLRNSKIRKNFLNELDKNGVETRPVISGNFLKQPSIYKYKINTKNIFNNSDIINNCGFFIGLPLTKINNNKLAKLVNIFRKSLVAN